MRRLAGLLLILFSQALAADSIAFIADLNGRYGSAAYDPRIDTAVEVITGLRPDLVICAGDMVAGQKQPQLDSELRRLEGGPHRLHEGRGA